MDRKRTGRQLFWGELGLIQGLVDDIASSAGLSQSESDYFASFAMSHLIAEDYAMLDAYRGRSTVRTYLTVVLFRLLREYQSRTPGRDTPKAPVKRETDTSSSSGVHGGRD